MTGLDLPAREDLYRRHGNFALAFSATYQPGLSYFGDERGFIAYRRVGGSTLVLSNPMAPPEMWADLIDGLVAQMGDVSFWQVSRRMAVLLADRGCRVNAIGVETSIDLGAYDFKGPKKRSFRTAANRMSANGLQTREVLASEINAEQLEAISVKWRQTRAVKSRELTFLIRPVVLGNEKGVRKFFTFDAGNIPVAFASFDPLYEDGTLTGYLMATKRWMPEADPLVGYELIRCAIETFQREGLGVLLFGLSPFAQVKDKDFNHSRSVKQALHFIRDNRVFNRYIYPIAGLNKHKASYMGVSETSYCTFNRRPGLLRLIRMSRACGIL
ncbi:hypothetical protein MNBD_ALPHA09-189 [hydrothermal vent metagenome]|uniref:Phosphatidylglycerol lysyltransferase C-terminal domain-containing protein n=1 Tax=hydrothermal vent metagenome TaxID=652676 RepID=A0A3B0T5P1_9ZZZZ